MPRIDDVKKVIAENYENADCGLYFCRNTIGDPMETIWDNGDVTIDICYHYSYFEVFGLTEEEEKELGNFYSAMERR